MNQPKNFRNENKHFSIEKLNKSCQFNAQSDKFLALYRSNANLKGVKYLCRKVK